MANSLTLNFDESLPTSDYPQTNAITQNPNKPTSTQSLTFCDPSFLLIVKLLKLFSAIQYIFENSHFFQAQ